MLLSFTWSINKDIRYEITSSMLENTWIIAAYVAPGIAEDTSITYSY